MTLEDNAIGFYGSLYLIIVKCKELQGWGGQLQASSFILNHSEM